MDAIRCDICGLAFGDPGAMARHREVCNEEVIALMRRDIGKFFMTLDEGKRTIGKIVGVKDCFGYQVNAIGYEELDDGTRRISAGKEPASLRSDEKWMELTRDEMRFQLSRIQGVIADGIMEVWS